MTLRETIGNSDCWKSDLLCLDDSAVSQALGYCAEICFDYTSCLNIRSLMPSIRAWTLHSCSKNRRRLAADLFQYAYKTGVAKLGGREFLEFPIGRWPIVTEDTAQTLAEDAILQAANSIATIGERSFFGSAGSCLECTERFLALIDGCREIEPDELLRSRILQRLDRVQHVG